MNVQTQKNILYLKKSFLEWNIMTETSCLEDRQIISRSYEIWNHSVSIANSIVNEFHLVDIITCLKRAVEHRTKIIYKFYNLKNLTIKANKKDRLELLTHLNIIRPLMLKKLYSIRNKVEHEDAAPPTLSECTELIDFVWYYLRSTDKICSEIPESLIFEDYSCDFEHETEKRNWLSISISPEQKWEIRINGWINEKHFVDAPTTPEELSSYVEFETKRSKQESFEEKQDISYQKSHSNKLDSDYWITGAIPKGSSIYEEIIYLYFKNLLI